MLEAVASKNGMFSLKEEEQEGENDKKGSMIRKHDKGGVKEKERGGKGKKKWRREGGGKGRKEWKRKREEERAEKRGRRERQKTKENKVDSPQQPVTPSVLTCSSHHQDKHQKQLRKSAVSTPAIHASIIEIPPLQFSPTKVSWRGHPKILLLISTSAFFH